MTAASGDLIGQRYRLEERINQGSTGVVWLAEELHQGRTIAKVAVKIFTVTVNDQEIRALAALQHGSILAYRTTVEHHGQTCLVTEYADGGDLQKLLLAYPQGLPEPQVTAIGDAVVQALQYLHQRSWVHRDVKPGNILYVGDRVKLGDVGTAKLIAQGATRHTVIGSMAYAAPETFAGQVSAASDVYSLGVTLFELLTGRLPFDGPPQAVMHQHLHAPAPIPVTLSPGWRKLLAGALAKDPVHRIRPQDIRDLLPKGDSSSAPQPASQVASAPSNAAAAAAAIDAMIADYLVRTGAQWTHAKDWGPFWALLQRVGAPLGRTDAELLAQIRAQTEAASLRPPSTSRPAVAQSSRSVSPSPVVPPTQRSVPTATVSGSDATLLQRELLGLIERYGQRWSSSDVWLPFWQALHARQPGFDEREAIRAGEQLFTGQQQSATQARRLELKVLQWVGERQGRAFQAREWLTFLDTLAAVESVIDANALGQIRDQALVRLWPRETGEVRRIAVGSLPALDLVYLSPEAIRRGFTLTQLFETPRGSAATGRPLGAWVSIKPLSLQQWYGLLQVPLPAKATQPETIAKVPYLGVVDRLLPVLRARFPLEELRLPSRNESAALRALVAKSAPAKDPASLPASAAPPTFGGLLAQAAVGVLTKVGEELAEWSCDEDAEARQLPVTDKRAVRLVSPIRW